METPQSPRGHLITVGNLLVCTVVKSNPLTMSLRSFILIFLALANASAMPLGQQSLPPRVALSPNQISNLDRRPLA